MNIENNNPIVKIPIYNFGSITFKELEAIANIKRDISTAIFNSWFQGNIEITNEDRAFFTDLIQENSFLLESYNEEELKIKFISPILNRVKFTNPAYEIRDFYEHSITYTTDKFILTGNVDFLVAKGLEYSKKPYFFIQEFKRSIRNDDPRPQLLAELLAAPELNNFQTIKGAFIIGENWNFVILNKPNSDTYRYFFSPTLHATKLEDLQQIYRNLCFVKQEIIEYESDNIN